MGSESYIEKAWSFHDFTVINVAYLSDWVASRILENSRTKKHLNQNLEMLLKWGKDVPELKISRPDAARYNLCKN